MAFVPTRASSPSKTLNGDKLASITADIARTSAAPISELKDLTPQDVGLIDAVIQRASPSATTFLAVFKAYNDILQEQGLNPHEVTYYGKLLKLGTIKARSWGEKWSMVKQQYGYSDGEQTLANTRLTTTLPSTQVVASAPVRPRPGKHFFEAGSPQGDSDFLRSESETSVDRMQYQQISRVTPQLSSLISRTNSLGLNIDTPGDRKRVDEPRFDLRFQNAYQKSDTCASTSSEDGKTAPTLPSYRAAMRDTPSLALPRLPIKGDRLLASPVLTASVARQAVARARERRGSVVNDEDAWNKIKISQDEKEADRFRDDKLVEHCWDTWRRGLQWIRTTNEQIGQARDCHLVRLSLHHWRNILNTRNQLHQRVDYLSNERRVRAAFNLWFRRLQDKRHLNWQHEIRAKMKSVQEKQESKLRKDAWAKWRQSYQSHLSRQHYAERLILRLYKRWKNRLFVLDAMDSKADAHLSIMDRKVVERTWNYWRREVEIKLMERTISDRVCIRVMGDAMKVWKRNLHDIRVSDAYHEYVLKKCAMRSWKTSRDRIRNLNNRALKHVARQDVVLLGAIIRVWKARERAKLLERVKSARLMKNTWATWCRRLEGHKRLEDLAVTFASRLDTPLVSSVFHTWREVYITHRNASSFALQYHSSRLQFRMLQIWRLQLRMKMKMAKEARVAERRFATRRAWRKLVSKFNARGRDRKLKAFEKRQVQKHFGVWLQLCRRRVQQRLSEQRIQSHTNRRIMKSTLVKWTNRVIEIKLRELDTTQRNESLALAAAFKKWKTVCVRHMEELSLMESYRFVKQEETTRRIFYHWLSAARASRHRRITLQRKEADLRHSRLALAWDTWRDRFRNEKLHPLELEVVAQSRNNLLFRMFGIWHSKTRSLPAIRFHASHLKSRCWHIWRSTMPRALEAKKARDLYGQTILAKALDKWSRMYRTKIALKAVARARYLRLPTAAPRPIAQSRPTVANDPAIRRTADADDDTRARPSQARSPRLLPPKFTITTRPRSDNGLPRTALSDRTRQPRFRRETEMERASRPRTPDENGLGQNRLWQELKLMRGRSRPRTSTSRSQSRERP